MASDIISLTAFIIVAVCICALFLFVLIRAARGNGCSCGKKGDSSSCSFCRAECGKRKRE